MGARLMHAFGILYRLYLCLFILFKFIKIFIGNCSRLRGDKHEKDRHSPCSLRAHILLRETESEHQINRIVSDHNKRYEENNLGWSEKITAGGQGRLLWGGDTSWGLTADPVKTGEFTLTWQASGRWRSQPCKVSALTHWDPPSG